MKPNAAETPATTFHPFARLPAELQLQICMSYLVPICCQTRTLRERPRDTHSLRCLEWAFVLVLVPKALSKKHTDLLTGELARPEPRAIKLIRAKKCHKYQAGYSRTRNVTSRARVPSLLHTCIDSRQVALKWYTQSFGWYKDYENTQKTHGPGGIYFDWSRDWVYLQCRECKEHEYNPARPSESDVSYFQV